jgi:hypothetical protein
MRFKTELTKPALCPFAALGEVISALATTAKRMPRGTNFFIITPITIKSRPIYDQSPRMIMGVSKNLAIISDD